MQKIGEIQALGHRLGIFEQEAPAFQCQVQYVLLDDEGDQWTTLVANLPVLDLERGEFPVKTWSENEVLREPLLASGIFVDTGKRIPTGFVTAELWRRAK